MVLAMSRPSKHPATGIYQFRKAVPLELRALVGKSEVKVSLRTRDVTEAKRLHAEMTVKVAREWQLLNAPDTELSHKQISALAGQAYREIVEPLGDDPGSPETWLHVERLTNEARTAGKLEQWIGGIIDPILASNGLKVGTYSRTRLIEATDAAIVRASQQLHRYASGDYSPDTNLVD